MADESQLPLLGVVLCCTSIPPEERSRLASVAEQMGAVHKFDLTSDVTHLIVGEIDTPKYKFVARERSDVKVLLPTWVETVRASWLEGGKTDVPATEQACRFPTFWGLKICLTGFDDLVFRKQLEDEVDGNGGQFHANLTKDVSHLIAKEPTGQKYDYAKQWGVKIVSIEWMQHSLERGMILEESLYHPLIPSVQRGCGAWIRRSKSSTSIGKRTRDSENGSQRARKLRRTISAKFEADTDGLWTNIVSAEPKVEKVEPSEWALEKVQRVSDELDDQKGPVTRSLMNARVQGQLEEPFPIPPKAEEQSGTPNPLAPSKNQHAGLFHGQTFVVHGFDEKKVLVARRHLESHGARVIQDGSSCTDVHFVLVPHTMSTNDVSGFKTAAPKATVVTDLWIERCLHFKSFESPSEFVTSTPITRFPLPGFENLKISWTGFQGIELLHLSKIIKLIGGSYLESFTPASSVLICNNLLSTEKLQHAQLWKIPAVKSSWIWDCIREGHMLPFDDYLVQHVSHPDTSNSYQTCKSSATAITKASQTDTELSRKSLTLERPRQRPPSKIENTLPKIPKREASSYSGKPIPTLECSFPDDNGPSLSENQSIPPHDPPGKQTLFARERKPLQETSPNSSPPKPKYDSEPTRSPPSSPPPLVGVGLKESAVREKSDSLGPAITSLLQHHQQSRSIKPPIDSSGPDQATSFASNGSQPLKIEDAPQRRRRRQLLGRAPSNLSSQNNVANNSRTVTRASSIDTTNTDGLGTPILPATVGITPSKRKGSNDLPLNRASHAAFLDEEDYEDPDKPSDEHLQMTQLGYADPDVAAWRERVSKKLAGGDSNGAKTNSGAASAAATRKTGNTNTPQRGEDDSESMGAGLGVTGDNEETIQTEEPSNWKAKHPSTGAGGLGIAKRTRLAAASAALSMTKSGMPL